MDHTRLRNKTELAVPGAAIGLLTGVIAGLLAAAVGLPMTMVLAAALGLAVPVAAFGAGYSLLVARGTFRPGVFAPAALYWLAAFPVARLVHEVVTHLAVAGRPGLPDDVLAFLAYQGLVSVGFALGFVWLHERLAPYWLLRIRERNPEAQHMFSIYLRHAEALQKERVSRRNPGKPAKAGHHPA